MLTVEQLFTPIGADQPSGTDLSFSSELDAISLARRFDDPSLDQGEWVTDLKEADWGFVARRCAVLLDEKSKDLRLAVWFTEASAKTRHLRGLGEGYQLLAGLCNRFWDDGLHPLSDEGDHEQRIGNLSWILARSPQLVREMALTEGRDTAFSTIDFEVARKQAGNAERRPDDGGRAAPVVKLAAMELARQKNSDRFCAAFAADAQFCMQALIELEQAVDARLGIDSPGFSTVKELLKTMLRVMPSSAADVVEVDVPATVEQTGSRTAAHAGPAGALQTRAQALTQLRLVAQFFRRTEPHSPVSYFADKAADAGEQSLHAWLRSVIKDPGSLAHIEELLGVQAPAASD